MRTRIAVRVIVAWAISLGAAGAWAEDGAKSVDAAWEKAIRAGDAAAAAACYAPDAVMWFPEAPEARGSKAIQDAYAGFFATWTIVDVALPNAVYQSSGDLSTGWGNYTMTVKPRKGGDAVVMKGRFTAVAKKIGGRWVYVADQASPDPPPPAPATAK